MKSRQLRRGEVLILRTLLDRSNEPRWKDVDVESLRASDMDDGRMGSLLFDTIKPDRRFGRTLAEGWFEDEDGFPVLLCLNLDEEDELFELDSWKVDFSRRRRLPRNEAEILSGPANMD